jgi:hypothetical protein
MIDRKTREKIIKLKEDGCSNSEIKKKTGVSAPTIRKIIKETSYEKIVIDRSSASSPNLDLSDFEIRLSNLERKFTGINGSADLNDRRIMYRFSINFTNVFPEGRCEDVWEMLSSGTARWRSRARALRFTNVKNMAL